jgi:hypothetical protein
MKRFTLLLPLVAVALATSSAHALVKRVYHIGNSVTDTINYNGLGAIASGMGDSYTFGRHMIPGAPLSWIYEHPNDGFREPSGYAAALPNQSWNVLTLQPFDRQLGTPTDAASTQNDLAVIREYVTLLRQNPANAASNIYIYSRWPRRASDTAPIDYPALWNRTYTGGWDGTNESKDYFQRVTVGTRQIITNLGAANRVNLVPVGDALFELDRRIKLGQVPGYTDITQFYADGIHLTNVGGYLTGLTFYATMYGKDPSGQPVPTQYSNAGYGGSPPLPISPALAAVLQNIAWTTVSTHPFSGYTAVIPEPASAALLLLAPPMLLRRRRTA